MSSQPNPFPPVSATVVKEVQMKINLNEVKAELLKELRSELKNDLLEFRDELTAIQKMVKAKFGDSGVSNDDLLKTLEVEKFVNKFKN